ncbi:MAG TPA: OsmC family peroxiredoxin [Candidatus Limnocylindrales bacterium]
MAETRWAESSWSGDLIGGAGSIDYVSSGSVSRLPVTWSSRTEAANGRTSPEEMVAAAHSSCFSMAFANGLAKAGHAPERLTVRASVSAEKREAGWTVISSAITVRGRVPGIGAADFKRLAEEAKENCPISRAIKGNVELSVEATLES